MAPLYDRSVEATDHDFLGAGARARGRVARSRASEADRRRGRRAATAVVVGEGVHGGARPPRRGRRARERRRASPRRDGLCHARALQPPGLDAALQRKRFSRPASHASSPASSTRTRTWPAAGSSGSAPPGVEVEVADGEPAFRARQQLEEWRTWVTQRRPFVTYKVAATLDGRVARARRALGERRGDRGGSCTCSGPPRMLWQSAWEPFAGTTRASTPATCRRRAASRAGSRSAAGRCPTAPSSSSAPGPLARGAGGARGGRRPVAAARRRADARRRVPRAGPRRQAARLRGADALRRRAGDALGRPAGRAAHASRGALDRRGRPASGLRPRALTLTGRCRGCAVALDLELSVLEPPSF